MNSKIIKRISISIFIMGNGNLTKDLNKKTANIEYNYLDLPRCMQFEVGNVISIQYGERMFDAILGRSRGGKSSLLGSRSFIFTCILL